MNRKNRVWYKLKELTKTLFTNGFDSEKLRSLNASFIGKKVGISRNNVSKELNQLVREGKALKIKGKPVIYLDISVVKAYRDINIETMVVEDYDTFMNMTGKNKHPDKKHQGVWPLENETKTDGTIFDRIIIGSQDSLKYQVEQAKAAILYPPIGLHTMIIGSTGTGKSTFAEAMYRYAVELGRLPADAPFVVFNCADYADNPQLLLSHLFGHVKGAFTGADKEKEGLVDSANKGVLFLDEVHRLPPEGQEMMFLLMDKGIYRRMGEVNNTRKAQMLIIAATTVEPQSTMLPTFLRRIPVLIRLPELRDRTLKERAAFICRFFGEESARLKLPVKVSKEVLKAFMLYDCPGNIGQLKSDIMLICASAFLDYITYKKSMVEVRLSHLSQRVREGFFRIGQNREELTKDFNLNGGEEVVFNGHASDVIDNINEIIYIDEYRANDDLYNLIKKSWDKYKSMGLPPGKIRDRLDAEIQGYFRRFISKIKPENREVERHMLFKVVSPRILEAVEEALNEVKDFLEVTLSQRLIFSIALHVRTLMERIRIGTIITHPDKESIAKNYPKEYRAARMAIEKLEKELEISIPEDETAYLAMFLYAAKAISTDAHIGILIIAHGESVATSIANVANSLLGIEHAHSIDMPLDEKVEAVLDKAIEMVQKIDTGKGVLLLVDMGSLTAFSEVITEKTGIPTRIIDKVNTPIVIEATRKALMPDMNIDRLVEEIVNADQYTSQKSFTYGTASSNYKASYSNKILVDILNKTLTFLNAEKSCEVLMSVLMEIANELGRDVEDDIRIKFLFHCSCMIERAIKNQPLPYNDLEIQKKNCAKLFNIVKKHFETLEEVFGASIPDTELAYVVEMLDTHCDTHCDTDEQYSRHIRKI